MPIHTPNLILIFPKKISTVGTVIESCSGALKTTSSQISQICDPLPQIHMVVSFLLIFSNLRKKTKLQIPSNPRPWRLPADFPMPWTPHSHRWPRPRSRPPRRRRSGAAAGFPRESVSGNAGNYPLVI